MPLYFGKHPWLPHEPSAQQLPFLTHSHAVLSYSITSQTSAAQISKWITAGEVKEKEATAPHTTKHNHTQKIPKQCILRNHAI